MLPRPFAKLQHLGKFVGGIDVQHRKGDFPEKRFQREPDEDVRILSHRPGHGDILEGVIGLSENENALVLEVIEMGSV